jgi:acetyl-CoA acetyltransferase
MPGDLSGKAAIVGIGATDFSKNSGHSELRLASEAVLDALDDAGLTPADVDGMVTFTMDSNTKVAIARARGVAELTFFSKIHHGGGAACATIQQSAIAVATGVAECVVAYRAFNERSGVRFGQVQMRLVENADSTGVDNSFSYPHGLSPPAAQVAMIAKRYMHLSGATSKDFGVVSVADRKHAANNPKAYFYEKPITNEDHQNSRWIAKPLRLMDCCQESDGAVAIVVTSPERSKDLKHRPVIIEAAAQGSSLNQYSLVSYYRPELGLPEMGLVGKQLWQQSGLKPTDIQTAILYDHFTPFTLIQLEELGFCGQGEAKDFIVGGAIEIGGRLLINTDGGRLGEAYIHGMNGIAEGVTSAARDVGQPGARCRARARHVGTGVPTSGLILAWHCAPARNFGKVVTTLSDCFQRLLGLQFRVRCR